MSSNDLVEASGLHPRDFESIRDAVMETPRGRWFLHEYANRLRGTETAGLIDSMKRLESAVSANHDALMARLANAMARGDMRGNASAPQADLAPKHMKFFKQDEDIFEPAPQAAIGAVPVAPKPDPKPEVPKGARVIIRRKGEPTAAPEAAPVQPEPPPLSASEPEALLPSPAVEADATPKRRIVIIRHKPGEQIDVPLQNEMSAVS
jgi:hypothetical protein